MSGARIGALMLADRVAALAVSTPAKVLILSAHLDDAVFSCGGLMATAAAEGLGVAVVTVFNRMLAGAAPSPFALSLLRAARLSPVGGDVARLAEDRRAGDYLGSAHSSLGYPDAVARRSAHGCVQHADPRGLTCLDRETRALWVGRVVRALLRLGAVNRQTLLLAPAAIGHHVDHQLCAAAARRLRDKALGTLFYEDFPYALAAGQRRVAPARRLLLTEAALERKVAAGLCYASQVRLIFGSPRRFRAGIFSLAGEAPRLWVERLYDRPACCLLVQSFDRRSGVIPAR